MPNYGLIIYNDFTYAGDILMNYKNRTAVPQIIYNANGTKKSIKIYYMDKEIT